MRRYAARAGIAAATALFVVVVLACLSRLSDHDAGQQAAIVALQEQVRSLGAEPVAGPAAPSEAGPSGRDGRDGRDGTNTVTIVTVPGPTVEGPPGRDSTTPGPPGPQGDPGPTGASGPAGQDGADGQNGQPGTPGQSAYPFTFTVPNVGTFTCSTPLEPCALTPAEPARK